jgi:hypothetical protein
MVLFYADVLGMKARWKTGDLDRVTEAYELFERLVDHALSASAPNGSVSGGVQSDAVALVFDETIDAVRFGKALFCRAFGSGNDTSRFWLRGLIIKSGVDGAELVTERPLCAAWPRIAVRHFSRELLNTVNIEQAYRGPRLLIAEDAIDASLRNALAMSVGAKFVIPLKQLAYTPVPDAGGPWWDVLYLLEPPLSQQSVEARHVEMGQRMRWAASRSHHGTDDELTHVAVLAVVWAECEAIAWDVGLRAHVFERPLGHEAAMSDGVSGLFGRDAVGLSEHCR